MRIIVACEESQAVTKAFREKGHEAYSCDIIPESGGHPEWHLQGSIFRRLRGKWDMMIGFPPCTYLTVTGNKWFKDEYKERFPNRLMDRVEAIKFFIKLWEADVEKIALENPIGIISSVVRQPDQIIQPYYFGDSERKSTCLWLKNLPKLVHSPVDDLFTKKTHVTPEIIQLQSGGTMSKYHYDSTSLPKEERSKIRSKTFPGIARAMAEQWG